MSNYDGEWTRDTTYGLDGGGGVVGAGVCAEGPDKTASMQQWYDVHPSVGAQNSELFVTVP
jgi:hypothetical protein